jgi:TrmH family RNA methyltransferase
MPVINSTTNFRVVQWGKLKHKTQRDKSGLFLAEGFHALSEAQKTGRLVEVVTTERGRPFDAETYQVTQNVMERLTSLATPTGVIGVCRQQEGQAIGDSVLVLDRIHYPGNLGTILRNAAAFGVDTVILDKTTDIYNPKAVQSSQGMVFHLNICKKPAAEAVASLRERGYQIIGTDVGDGMDLREVKPPIKRAVLIGNEGEGLDGALLSLCDVKVRIGMDGRCESLNAGVAAGIILYSLSRHGQ